MYATENEVADVVSKSLSDTFPKKIISGAGAETFLLRVTLKSMMYDT